MNKKENCRKKMKWNYINNPEEKEEIDMLIRQIINKLQFMEKSINCRIHNIKIENKRSFMKGVLAQTYLNETQLPKIRNIKTENHYLNQNMDIKLINFEAKLKEYNWYHGFL